MPDSKDYPEGLQDEDLRDLAHAEFESSMAFGISVDSFTRLAKTVRDRAQRTQAAPAPQGVGVPTDMLDEIYTDALAALQHARTAKAQKLVLDMVRQRCEKAADPTVTPAPAQPQEAPASQGDVLQVQQCDLQEFQHPAYGPVWFATQDCFHALPTQQPASSGGDVGGVQADKGGV